MGMIPGMSKMQSQANIYDQEIEQRIKRVEAIINTMTGKERDSDKPHRTLNASRKKRIAAGSGVEVRGVNDLLKQFSQMQQLMNQLKKGKFPKIPGMPI
jgi:signal recognition particle subunit SRP54